MGITAIVGAIGVGAAAAGAGTSIAGAIQQGSAQRQEIAIQSQEQQQRKQLFELEQQRKTVEDYRQAQLAGAKARTSAVAQGAQFGSGLLGGLAEIQGESNYNILGIKQNTAVGEKLFSLDQQLSEAKIRSAQAATLQQTGSALTSLGGTLVNSMGDIGKLTSGGGNFFSPNAFATYNPSGRNYA